MLAHIRRFRREETGATSIEYGVIAAGICIAIVTVVYSLGTSLNVMFASVATAFN
jgi:pilus assembly protein Flp/PilA